MFLGNDDKVYILDKAENNPTQINGHPAWGSVWDIPTMQATAVEITSNAFCAAGAILPNNSFVTFGGNKAVKPDNTQTTGVSDWDDTTNPLSVAPVYNDIDGRRAIRIVSPEGCTGDVNTWGPDCQWFDDPSTLHLAKERWYATAESLGDGTVLLIGGMIFGGYINRFRLHDDPVTQHRQAENTLEFYPARADTATPPVSQFLVNAGGLNTYAHAFLLKSGKMFMQANISTITLDTDTLEETPLPDMPEGIIRVYPASAGVAMLPLTPENNYNPTILFCGGTNAFTDEEWGDYHSPHVNSWERRASADCRRITPEPEDGSAVEYVKDDDMIDPRTMGQFIIMPDGKLLMVNGGRNGTAGYTTDTPTIPSIAQMPFGMSLATEECLKPAIYDPSAPAGSRWTDEGLGESKIPRLYHSSAILLPDGSVMIAGSNPGADRVDPGVYPYPTTYDAEIFYPPYFANISSRPVVDTAATPIPKTLTYGGAFFNLTLENKYKSPNDAAERAKVVLLRSGFTTHGMNMGQRMMQLNSTYSVGDDGKVTLSVSPPPPNSNLLTPGPALFFVVVDGVPSVGTHVRVGNGVMGKQPTTAVVALPVSRQNEKFAAAGSNNSVNGSTEEGGSKKTITYAVIAAVVVVALIALGVGLYCCRRRKAAKAVTSAPPMMAASSSSKMGGYDAERNMSQYSSAAPSMPYGGSEVNLPPQQPHDYERYGAPVPVNGGAVPMQRAYSPPQQQQQQQYYSPPHSPRQSPPPQRTYSPPQQQYYQGGQGQYGNGHAY
ncbi:DUF1929-domain-containing protein, partial [Exidia glandulosa HHB12029]